MSDYAKLIQQNEESLIKQSRSFAVPISALEDTFKIPIMVEYNLNKTIDTIEDNPQLSVAQKIKWITAFCDALKARRCHPELAATLLPLTPPEEAFVFKNYEATLGLFQHLSAKEQALAISATEEMAVGMCQFLEQPIETPAQLNQYCYYVAGTVGVYLTDLYQLKSPLELTTYAKLKELACSFGLFLQKLNIIRDFREDKEEKNRSFWPQDHFKTGMDKVDILNLLCRETRENDVPKAIAYCENLPQDNLGFNYFIRFVLLSGLEYLNLLQNNGSVFSKIKVKLPKLFIKSLYRQVSRVDSDVFITNCWRLAKG